MKVAAAADSQRSLLIMEYFYSLNEKQPKTARCLALLERDDARMQGAAQAGLLSQCNLRCRQPRAARNPWIKSGGVGHGAPIGKPGQ
jgi:hypothetical protein